jgi:hypothetical protein
LVASTASAQRLISSGVFFSPFCEPPDHLLIARRFLDLRFEIVALHVF